MQNLGTLAGATFKYMPIWAWDINDAGQVVGIAMDQETQTRHGFLYSNGQLEDLGSLNDSEILEPRAINSAGDIVGNSWSIFDQSHTFLRTQGALLELNELLVSTDSTWQVVSANDINDFGQIAATAVDPQKGRRAVVLSPVPIVTVEGPSEVATSATSRMIKGRSSGHALKVFCRVGNGRLKPAAGTSSWRFRGKLRPGRNIITVTAYGPFGHSAPKKVIVRRR
jgi:probable HAF family extracellular repeat protein